MSWKKVKLGSVLQQYRVTHLVQDATVYKQVTISKHDGVCYRGAKIGKEIGRKRQFLIDLKKHPSTFMFVRQGVSDGALGIAPPEVDGCIATENMPMFAVKGIEVNYLNLLLKSIDFKRQLDQIPTLGSAQKAIHERQLLDIEIPLPSADEQRETIRAFEEHRISVLSIVVESDQQLTHLTQLRQALLREAMQGQLLPQDPTDEPAALLLKKLQKEKDVLREEGKLKNERALTPAIHDEADYSIPDNWTWSRLGEIGNAVPNSIVDGPFGSAINVNADYISQGVPVIRMGNIKPFNFVKQNFRYVSFEKFATLRRHNILPGDVLIGKVGSIGQACLYPNDMPEGMLSTTGSCRFRVSQVVVPAYLCYFINSITEYMNKIATKGNPPYLTLGPIKNILFPLPPLAEQHRIVAKLEQLLQHCDALEQRIRESRRLAEQLLQTALREALAPPAGPEEAEVAELEIAETEVAPARARRGRPRQPKFSLDNPPPDLFDGFR